MVTPDLYQHYLQKLKMYATDLLSCPHCGGRVSFAAFEKHCTSEHRLDANCRCVWCHGNKSFPPGKKVLFGAHLLYCLLQVHSIVVSIFNLGLMSPKRRSFGHSLDNLYLKTILPTPADPASKSFGCCYLNLAVSYFEKYVATEQDTDWFHVIVRNVSMPSFVWAMRHDAGRSTTLPFWCWCDGGPYPESHQRVHRHMIVVSSPKGHFLRNVFPHITTVESPYPHYLCKMAKRIESKKQWINTLGYVSHRKGQCRFGFEWGLGGFSERSHFYVYTPLPSIYKSAMALLYEGGILERLHEQFDDVNPYLLAEAPGLVQVGSKWQIPLRELPGIPFQLRVGVTAHVPHQCVYLRDKRVLPVGEHVRIPFYQKVKDIWVPSSFQQAALYLIRGTSFSYRK